VAGTSKLDFCYREHEGFTFVIKNTNLKAPRKNGRTSEIAKCKLFARHRANVWAAWGNEVPVESAA